MKIEKQSGFTMIELMIVIAIIGVLGSIAYPFYQDYTQRVYLVEGLQLASSAKAAVLDYHVTNGSYPTDSQTAGYTEIVSGSGVAVNSIKIINNQIEVTFNNKVNQGGKMILTATQSANGSFIWVCTANNLLKAALLPKNCRP